MTASGSTGGWKFDNKTGQLIANITAYQTAVPGLGPAHRCRIARPDTLGPPAAAASP
jgi:hypothetical protein